MLSVNFNGTECNVKFGKYMGGGGIAMVLIDNKDFMPYCTATINVNGLDENCIAIKDYEDEGSLLNMLDENSPVIKNYKDEGDTLLDTLISSGIVSDTGRRVKLGYVEAAVVRLTPKALREADMLNN